MVTCSYVTVSSEVMHAVRIRLGFGSSQEKHGPAQGRARAGMQADYSATNSSCAKLRKFRIRKVVVANSRCLVGRKAEKGAS